MVKPRKYKNMNGVIKLELWVCELTCYNFQAFL